MAPNEKKHASKEVLSFKNFIYGKHSHKIKECKNTVSKIKFAKKI